MKKSDQLKQERQAKLDAQQNLIALRSQNEGGDFTAEQRSQWDTLQSDVANYDTLIARELEVEAVQLRTTAAAATVAAHSGGDSEEREYDKLVKDYSIHRAMAAKINHSGQTGVEGEVQQELTKRAKDAGVSAQGLLIPMSTRNQNVTNDNGDFGANLVDEDLMSPIDFLRPNPVLRQVGARFMTNLRGNVGFPVNEGGIAATWEGETATVGGTRNRYGKRQMTPKRLAATVGLSLQNILQSNIDLERYTIDEINRVVSIAIDAAGINGSGAGNVPLGILNHNGVAVIDAGANGGAPTWNHIVGLETAVMDQNYMGNDYAYLINSRTKGCLKVTPHQANELNYLMSMSNEINGYKVGKSNLVPGDLAKGTGTDLSAGIFGDFSQLLIGQWGFMDMVVDNITGAKDGIVEITVNSFLDILLRHPEAFAVVKDWDTAGK